MTQRPLSLSADHASSLPRPDHQGGVGPAHRQQGGVILSPADVGHLGAVPHVTLKTSVLTLERGGRRKQTHLYVLRSVKRESNNKNKDEEIRIMNKRKKERKISFIKEINENVERRIKKKSESEDISC